MQRRVTTRLRAALAGVVIASALTASAVAGDPAPADPVKATARRSGHSDAARARERVNRGDFLPLERIAADATRRYPGRIAEVELEGAEYEIELLTDDGNRVELEYDARTGRLLEVELDD
jgi:uncharacterized membrane protein YkoI